MAGASASQARWELENDVASIADADAFLTYDDAGQKAFQASRPWAKEPQYFQKCALCLPACARTRLLLSEAHTRCYSWP